MVGIDRYIRYFADDIALLAEKDKELQELVTVVAEISTKMRMCINKTETQVLGKGGNKLQPFARY